MNLEDIRNKTTSFSTDPGSIYCSRWNTLLISPLDAVYVGLVSSLYILLYYELKAFKIYMIAGM